MEPDQGCSWKERLENKCLITGSQGGSEKPTVTAEVDRQREEVGCRGEGRKDDDAGERDRNIKKKDGYRIKQVKRGVESRGDEKQDGEVTQGSRV